MVQRINCGTGGGRHQVEVRARSQLFEILRIQAGCLNFNGPSGTLEPGASLLLCKIVVYRLGQVG